MFENATVCASTKLRITMDDMESGFDLKGEK